MLLPTREATVEAPFDQMTLEICEQHPDVIVMSADLSPYVDIFSVRKLRPLQYLDVGMAEQNLMSVGAGLSKAGYIPIATTFAVYASRRAYDQMVICMGTGPRTCIVVGFTPGITNPARVHHQSIEDLAIMRTVPNATVIDPMDATEFAAALPALLDRPGLVYIRGHRGTVARLLDPNKYRFVLGKTHLLRQGSTVGLISTGHGSQWALEVSDKLTNQGIDHSHLHVPTIKPVNEDEIWEFCIQHKQIFTIENHSVVGGLGGLVAEVMANYGGGPRLTRFGVPDTWAPGGSLGYIRTQLQLDADTLVRRIKEKM
jgi:transketolase